jgi:ATP-binding cassette subfamily F protein uup
MLQPADLLILDEPTNDLDIPTLEVLEESLADFPGALVLVTRDRFLLERVCTRVLALDGAGGAIFFADYPQWESAREESHGETGDRLKAPARTGIETRSRPAVREGLDVRRLTYLEKREWEQMEQLILRAEEACAACQKAVEDPAVASDPIALRERWVALEAARAEVDCLYARWADLEEKQR